MRLFEVLMSEPRGLRNHNPLNIRHSSDDFIGEVTGTDPDFKTFESNDYGYRAAFVILYSYLKKAVCTIEEIIHHWAPASENDTDAYIAAVEKESGIDRHVILTSGDGERYKRIVSAMSHMENGVKAVNTELEEGFAMQNKLSL